jgi:biotin operon repressor
MLTFGEYASAAELARALGMSRARVTQVLSLLRLHPYM